MMTASGIGASDSSCPKPRYNGFAVSIRIEFADFLESLRLEQFAVVENVVGETFCAAIAANKFVCSRVDGRLIFKRL